MSTYIHVMINVNINKTVAVMHYYLTARKKQTTANQQHGTVSVALKTTDYR